MKCPKCRYKWIQRAKSPKECPRCKGRLDYPPHPRVAVESARPIKVHKIPGWPRHIAKRFTLTETSKASTKATLICALLMLSTILPALLMLQCEPAAAFPDTLGYDTEGTTGDQNVMGRITGSWWTTESSGTAENIKVSWHHLETLYTKCAIYENQSGTWVKIGETNEIGSGYEIDAWIAYTVSGSVVITAGKQYYLVVWAHDYADFAGVNYDSETGRGGYQDVGYGDWPNTFTPTPEDRKYSIYLEYAPEGEEPPVLPTKPTLLSPENGAVLVHDNTPYFEWLEGENADNHRLVIDNNSDFSSPKENRVLTVSYYKIADENYLSDNTYYWKVVAANENGENESEVRMFRILTSAPFTFGYTENGAENKNVRYENGQRILGSAFHCNHLDGYADNITAYFGVGEYWDGNVRAAIYTTSGTLIEQTEERGESYDDWQDMVAPTWWTFSFSIDNRPWLTADEEYVLVLWGSCDIQFAYLYDNILGIVGYYANENYVSQFPGSVTFTADGIKRYSIYCSVSYVGGPPANPKNVYPGGGWTSTDSTPELWAERHYNEIQPGENISAFRFLIDNDSDMSSPQINVLVKPVWDYPDAPYRADYQIQDNEALSLGVWYYKVQPKNPLYERTDVQTTWLEIQGPTYVTTLDATSVLSTSAVLNANINYGPKENVGVYFEYKSEPIGWELENYETPIDSAMVGNWGNREPIFYIVNTGHPNENDENTYVIPAGTQAYITIQKAIDNLYENYGGGKVFLFNGTYTTGSMIKLKSNISLVGESKENTIIKQNSYTSYFIWGNGADNVLIENLHIWGWNSSYYLETMGIDFFSWKTEHAVVRNVVAHGFSYSAFFAEAWSINIPHNDIWFINCEAYDTSGPAIGVLNTENFYIINCYVHDSGHEPGYYHDYADGIAVWSSAHGVVANNIIENTGAGGIWLERTNWATIGDRGAPENVLVVGNRIENINFGGGNQPYIHAAEYKFWAENYPITDVMITNNLFLSRENHFGYGVELCLWTENCTIENNNFLYLANTWSVQGSGHIVENNAGVPENTIKETAYSPNDYSKKVTGLTKDHFYSFRAVIEYDSTVSRGLYKSFTTAIGEWHQIENWSGTINAENVFLKWKYVLPGDQYFSGSPVAITPDGGYIVMGEVTGHVHYFTENDNNPQWTFNVANYEGYPNDSGWHVDGVDISNDGEWVCVSCNYRVYLLHPDNQIVWRWKGGDYIYRVSISGDGQWIVGTGQGVRVWGNNDNMVEWFWQGDTSAFDASISDDGQYIVVSGYNKISLLDRTAQQMIWSSEISKCAPVRISKEYITVGAWDGAYVYHISDNTPLWSYRWAPSNSSAITYEEKYAVFSSFREDKFYIFDISQNFPRIADLPGEEFAVASDLRYLVATARDNTLYLYRNLLESPETYYGLWEDSPIDDTYVAQGFPNTNYGSEENLNVDWRWGGNENRIFLKFNTENFKENIDKALLYLYTFSTDEKGIVEVYKVENDDWLEGEITWNNCPSIGTKIIHEFLLNIWTYWNISDWVKNQIENDNLISLSLKYGGAVVNSKSSFIYSQEASQKNPRLVIQFLYHSDNIPPYSPVELVCENYENGNPQFSAIYLDANPNQSAVKAWIQVGTKAATPDMWNSDWIDIESIENNMRCENILYDGDELSYDDYYWRIRFADNCGQEGIWSSVQIFSISAPNVGPNPPTDLLFSGEENPTKFPGDWIGLGFCATGTDNDGDDMTHYRIQIDNDSDFSSVFEDTGKKLLSQRIENNQSATIFAGTMENEPARGITWYWRINFYDSRGAEGEWSTEMATFKRNQLPSLPTNWTDLGTRLVNHNPTISWTKGVDPDGDYVSTHVYVSWGAGYQLETSTSGESAELGHNVNLYDGWTYYYRLRSHDGYEFSAYYTDADEFHMNTPPVIEEPPWISPQLPIDADDLTCIFLLNPPWDAEGDSITLSYRWFENDDLMSGQTTDTLSNNLTVVNNRYKCEVKPYDGYEYGSAETSNDVVIRAVNTPPTTSNPKCEGKINPTDVSTSHPTFSWTFSDADGDTQSNWQIYVGTGLGLSNMWNSGTRSGSYTSDTYAGQTLENDVTYYWQVRTKDSRDWSEWATGTFKTLFAAAIIPTPALENEGKYLFIKALGDATVFEANPDDQYGADTKLYCGRTAGLEYSYLKFDISTLKDYDWIRIQLKLIADYSPNAPTVEVWRVTGDWSEANVTWNTRPLLIEQVAVMNWNKGDDLEKYQSYYADVSAVINSVLDQKLTEISFALVPRGDTSTGQEAVFFSREAGEFHTLDVLYIPRGPLLPAIVVAFLFTVSLLGIFTWLYVKIRDVHDVRTGAWAIICVLIALLAMIISWGIASGLLTA